MPRPQKVPFDAWTEKEATEALPPTVPEYEANALFVEGDHWQQGNGWVGPRPGVNDDAAEAAAMMALVETGFVSRNAIGEVVERHANGVAGREPGVQWVPRVPLPKDQTMSDQQLKQSQEISDLLGAWWDKRKVAQTLWEFTATLAWAGRAVLRLFIPRGLLTTTGNETTVDAGGDIALALDFVYLMQPTPKSAGVAIDEASQQECGIFQTELAGKKVTELTYVPGLDAAEKEEGVVILRILGGESESRTPLETGGRLLIFQARRPLMITKSVQQNQRALNLAMSVLPRNIVTGGFLERILLNAMMPGHYEIDEDTGKKEWVRDPFAGGAGTTQFIVGVKETDEEGNVKRATPSVVFRDPVPVDTTLEAAGGHYRAILDEVDQAHVLLNAMSESSGRAREQARADFAASLMRSAHAVEPATVWVAETVLALGEHLAGKVGQITTQWRAVAQCNLDEGPLPQNERAQNVAEYEAGLLARRSAMVRNNVADPQAELDAMRVDEQLEQTLGVLRKRAEIMQLLVASGASLLEAAIAAGWEEKDARAKFPDRPPPGEGNPDSANGFADAGDDEETGAGFAQA